MSEPDGDTKPTTGGSSRKGASVTVNFIGMLTEGLKKLCNSRNPSRKRCLVLFGYGTIMIAVLYLLFNLNPIFSEVMSAPIQVSDGVTKSVITPGNGQMVTRGASVTVHCTGMLTEGLKKFWSTRDPGQTEFTFKAGVGQVGGVFLLNFTFCFSYSSFRAFHLQIRQSLQDM